MSINNAYISIKNCFSYGQAYVALSRLKSLEGLYIIDEKINPCVVRAAPKCLNFYGFSLPLKSKKIKYSSVNHIGNLKFHGKKNHLMSLNKDKCLQAFVFLPRHVIKKIKRTYHACSVTKSFSKKRLNCDSTFRNYVEMKYFGVENLGFFKFQKETIEITSSNLHQNLDRKHHL